MKMHLNLAASNLEESVAFYRALLDRAPTKHFDDYALFITENPGLELALDCNPNAEAAHGVHFGVLVDSADSVHEATKRLQAADIETFVESSETCCYARQTKVWANDPDGRRWEVYTVHDEMPHRQDVDTRCCAGADGSRGCCPG